MTLPHSAYSLAAFWNSSWWAITSGFPRRWERVSYRASTSSNSSNISFSFPPTLTFQDRLKGPKGHFDLVLGGFAGGQPLKPKSGLDKVPHHPALPPPVGKADDLVGEPCDQGDEDQARGYLIPKRDMMGNKGKGQNAYHHHDQEEARTASRVEKREALHPIDQQFLPRFEGKDRLVLRAMIFKNATNLPDAGDRPQKGKEDRHSQCTIP